MTAMAVNTNGGLRVTAIQNFDMSAVNGGIEFFFVAGPAKIVDWQAHGPLV